MLDRTYSFSFEVEQIVDEKIIDGQTHFLVKWLGYGHEENTWEPMRHMTNSKDKVREWENYKLKIQKKLQAQRNMQMLDLGEQRRRIPSNDATLISKSSKPVSNPYQKAFPSHITINLYQEQRKINEFDKKNAESIFDRPEMKKLLKQKKNDRKKKQLELFQQRLKSRPKVWEKYLKNDQETIKKANQKIKQVIDKVYESLSLDNQTKPKQNSKVKEQKLSIENEKIIDGQKILKFNEIREKMNEIQPDQKKKPQKYASEFNDQKKQQNYVQKKKSKNLIDSSSQEEITIFKKQGSCGQRNYQTTSQTYGLNQETKPFKKFDQSDNLQESTNFITKRQKKQNQEISVEKLQRSHRKSEDQKKIPNQSSKQIDKKAHDSPQEPFEKQTKTITSIRQTIKPIRQQNFIIQPETIKLTQSVLAELTNINEDDEQQQYSSKDSDIIQKKNEELIVEEKHSIQIQMKSDKIGQQFENYSSEKVSRIKQSQDINRVPQSSQAFIQNQQHNILLQQRNTAQDDMIIQFSSAQAFGDNIKQKNNTIQLNQGNQIQNVGLRPRQQPVVSDIKHHNLFEGMQTQKHNANLSKNDCKSNQSSNKTKEKTRNQNQISSSFEYQVKSEQQSCSNSSKVALQSNLQRLKPQEAPQNLQNFVLEARQCSDSNVMPFECNISIIQQIQQEGNLTMTNRSLIQAQNMFNLKKKSSSFYNEPSKKSSVIILNDFKNIKAQNSPQIVEQNQYKTLSNHQDQIINYSSLTNHVSTTLPSLQSQINYQAHAVIFNSLRQQSISTKQSVHTIKTYNSEPERQLQPGNPQLMLQRSENHHARDKSQKRPPLSYTDKVLHDFGEEETNSQASIKSQKNIQGNRKRKICNNYSLQIEQFFESVNDKSMRNVKVSEINSESSCSEALKKSDISSFKKSKNHLISQQISLKIENPINISLFREQIKKMQNIAELKAQEISHDNSIELSKTISMSKDNRISRGFFKNNLQNQLQSIEPVESPFSQKQIVCQRNEGFLEDQSSIISEYHKKFIIYNDLSLCN